MHKLFAQLTIGFVVAYIVVKVADDQLQVTAKINQMIRGT